MEQQEAYVGVMSVSSHSHTGPAPVWGRREGFLRSRGGLGWSRAEPPKSWSPQPASWHQGRARACSTWHPFPGLQRRLGAGWRGQGRVPAWGHRGPVQPLGGLCKQEGRCGVGESRVSNQLIHMHVISCGCNMPASASQPGHAGPALPLSRTRPRPVAALPSGSPAAHPLSPGLSRLRDCEEMEKKRDA